MGHHYDADFSTTYLFPPALEDWVAPDHPARFVRDFVDAALLAGDLALDWAAGEGGAPAFAPALLLRVWLYGYYEGVRGTRALEKACRDRLPFVWLCGRHTPDHNTLWRFFHRNKPALNALFKRTLKVALDTGCVGFVWHAVDGTRVPAASATRSGWHKTTLEERLEKLDAAIAALEAAVEAEGAGGAAPPDALPAALAEAKARRAAVQAAYDALRLEGVDHLHPREPEARIQKCQDRGKKLFGYNAQAVVDATSGLIVAQAVVPDENDQEQLAPMLAQAKANLGNAPGLTAADKGYARGESLKAAKDAGLPACVALPEPLAGPPDKPYHSACFTYDATTDTVICPQGQALPYVKDRTHKDKGYTVRVYRCACKECPVKAQCTTNKQGREYEWAPFHEALEEQRALTRSERGRAALRMRKQTVEPVFGQIKEGGRFRRFTVYGLEAVQAQWTLVCAAFNLKKLYALWRRGVLCLFGPPPVTPAPAAALAVRAEAVRRLAPRPLQRLTTLG